MTVKMFKLTIAFAVLLLNSPLLTAHSKLKSSQPENKQVVTHLPKELVLNFNQAVRLIKLKISDANRDNIALPFKAHKEAKQKFQVPLPQLKPSEYIVNWTIMGADSHIIKGDFSFTYQPNKNNQIKQ